MNVRGSDVSSEQLALADGDGAGARDKAGPIGRTELDRLKVLLDLSAPSSVAELENATDAFGEILGQTLGEGLSDPAKEKKKR